MSLGLELLRTGRVAASHALCALCLVAASAAWAQATAAAPQPSPVVIRFLDSATGYALQPDVTMRPERAGAPEKSFGPGQVAASGHGAFALEAGRHTLTAAAPGYQPLSAPLVMPTSGAYQIQVLLDPIELPRELRHEDIAARQREGATLIQGFIVDDDSGEPLRGVRVASTPSGVETVSDARGFYEIYVPVPGDLTEVMANVSVAFEKPGYQAQEQQYWELWSRGDWTQNVRLHRGAGRQVVDQRKLRREMAPEEPGPGAKAASLQPAPPSASTSLLSAPVLSALEAKFVPPEPTDPGTATVRVPRNIRVLEDNVTPSVVYYVTMDFYEKHVLVSEWKASWASAGGGSGTNSLNAGAVAVRCYAINRLNNRDPDGTHDICGSSDCQNFNVNKSNEDTDKAVEYTAGCVLLNASGNIAGTEYSSENNSKDRGDCGDGFTAPSGGCLYDPVCVGRGRVGHGRGMCQWGSKFWATGEKGFPKRDWVWIVYHYYPNLRLARGAPLLVGDNVRAETTLDVRACSGGGIDGGVTCPLITTKATGQTGVIIGAPLVVTNDGSGFTWYQVRWNDAGSTTGWSCENYLERLFSAPSAPATLTATALATNRIDLSWTLNSSVEAGFLLERAPAAGGPWLKIAQLQANVTAFSDGDLPAGSTWSYRVLAFNAAGNSAYSAVATATTPAGVPPTLSPVHDRQVTPGTLITFTNMASAPERVQPITDFEPFMSETANGVVVFRTPNFSTSTSGFLDSGPDKDLAAVTDTYPNTGHGTGLVLYVRCNFTNGSNPWLRLTTSGAESFPNPVIDFTKKLRFDIYADQSVKVAVGCRETTTPAGTVIGADGGTVGAIEWAGVTNIAGTAPMPTRVIASNTWTTLTFDLPHEPIRSFSGGNNALSTASGLGVLEHLAIVPVGLTSIPAGSTNHIYKLYLDNFAALVPRTFTYSLGAGAPANASLNPTTGVFAWTPTAAQSPSTNFISIVVTDNSSPPLRATNTFSVIVEDYVPNGPPVLEPIPNQTVYARSTLTLPIGAFDPNESDTLTFSLEPGAPPAAAINPVTGVLTWTTTDGDTNSVHPITVRVIDNRSPPLSATAAFSVTVIPPPPPNLPPWLFPVGNHTVNAGSTLTFPIYAYDDNEGDTLTFSLSSDSPAGASINPASGVFTWTPEDALSNTVHSVTARATDDGQPRMTASTTFSVTVLSHLPNHAPVLAAVPGKTVHAGSTVVFTNTASDEDTADTLSFSMDDNAPAGANIDTVSGIFAWTPSDAESDTTNSIVVWVTDDGEPPLSASVTADIIVLAKPNLHAALTSATTAVLTWSAIPNVKYRVLYKNSLSVQVWETLGSDITATGSTATTSDTALGSVQQRFYRVQVVE
jgi:Putative Ig domain/Stage II sporulation protein